MNNRHDGRFTDSYGCDDDSEYLFDNVAMCRRRKFATNKDVIRDDGDVTHGGTDDNDEDFIKAHTVQVNTIETIQNFTNYENIEDSILDEVDEESFHDEIEDDTDDDDEEIGRAHV